MDVSISEMSEEYVKVMENNDDDDDFPLNEALETLGCCSRCLLRFNAQRDHENYREGFTSDEENENGQMTPKEEKSSKNSKLSVCPLCLGILQEICEQSAVDRIGEKIKSAGFEFESFSLAVALPLELGIRQHALLLYLKEKYRLEINPQTIISVKDVFKWVCGPLFAKCFGVPYSPQSLFEVLMTFKNEGTQNEPSELLSAHQVQPQKKRRRGFKSRWKQETVAIGPTKQQISDILTKLTEDEFKEAFTCPPVLPKNLCTCDVSGLHSPIYVAGRYLKYSRTLSQSPWVLEDGERKTESSVEELVCIPIKEKLHSDDYKFASSGREDVDVRMLGNGRPFVAEMINPHKIFHTEESIRELQKVINSRTTEIAVRDLQIVTRDDTSHIKNVLDKKKSYHALIWTEDPVDQLKLETLDRSKDLVVHQKTPVRVLHRRTLAERERTVYDMRTEVVDKHHFKLYISTQAGTYIKEFAHGDFGRTQPNIGTLLSTRADIVELDVEAVELDWPKTLDNT